MIPGCNKTFLPENAEHLNMGPFSPLEGKLSGSNAKILLMYEGYHEKLLKNYLERKGEKKPPFLQSALAVWGFF